MNDAPHRREHHEDPLQYCELFFFSLSAVLLPPMVALVARVLGNDSRDDRR
jgi:hypothetical protein